MFYTKYSNSVREDGYNRSDTDTECFPEMMSSTPLVEYNSKAVVYKIFRRIYEAFPAFHGGS